MNNLEAIFQKLNLEQTGVVEGEKNNNDIPNNEVDSPNVSEESHDLDAILNCTSEDLDAILNCTSADDNEGLMSLFNENEDIGQILARAKTNVLDRLMTNSEDDSLEDYKHKINALMGEDNEKALVVCERGLKKFPDSLELLSYKLHVLGKMGDLTRAAEVLNVLEKAPKDKYTFEVFSNVNDYLLLDAKHNKARVIRNIKACKKQLPSEERVCILEADLCSKLDDHKGEIKALYKGIKHYKNAMACALNLQKHLVDDCEFEKGLKIGQYIAICKTRLTVVTDVISIDLAELQNCLCLQGILCKRIYRGKTVDKEEIRKVLNRYTKLKEEYPKMGKLFSDEIKNQEKTLKLMLE